MGRELPQQVTILTNVAKYALILDLLGFSNMKDTMLHLVDVYSLKLSDPEIQRVVEVSRGYHLTKSDYIVFKEILAKPNYFLEKDEIASLTLPTKRSFGYMLS